MSSQRYKSKLLFCATIAFVISASGCTQLPKMSMPSLSIKSPRLSLSDRSAELASHMDGDISLGRLAERRGNNTRAKEIFKSVLKQSPGHRLANHRLAVIAAKEGQLEKSIEFFRAAQAGEGQDSAELLADLGYIEYLMGNLEAAEISLAKSLDLDATNERTLNNLGLVTGMMGKNRESFSYFEQAVGKAEAHANLAYVLSQRGTDADLNQSANHYHQALESDGDLRIAAHALMQIQQRLPNRNLEQMPAREMQLATSGSNDWRERAANVMPQLTREAIASSQPEQQQVASAPAPVSKPVTPNTASSSVLDAIRQIEIKRSQIPQGNVVENDRTAQGSEANHKTSDIPVVAAATPPVALVNHQSPVSPVPTYKSVPPEPAHFALPKTVETIARDEATLEEATPEENTAEPQEPAEPIVVLGNSFTRPLSFDL